MHTEVARLELPGPPISLSYDESNGYWLVGTRAGLAIVQDLLPTPNILGVSLFFCSIRFSDDCSCDPGRAIAWISSSSGDYTCQCRGLLPPSEYCSFGGVAGQFKTASVFGPHGRKFHASRLSSTQWKHFGHSGRQCEALCPKQWHVPHQQHPQGTLLPRVLKA